MTSLSVDDTKNILKQAQNIGKGFAQILGPKLPQNTSLSDASKGKIISNRTKIILIYIKSS
jgi:hypothetical protein